MEMDTNILQSLSLLFPTTLVIMTIMLNTESAYATHTSLPVIEPMEQYMAGRVYDLNGLILYNGQPTSDVLVEVRIDAPYGSSAEYVRSASDGRFTVAFKPSTQGYYTITAISHCRDVHRSICTYQSTVFEVAVYEEVSVDRLCILGGECINIHSNPITMAIIDTGLESEPIMVDSSRRSLVIRLSDVGDRAHLVLALPSNIIDASSRFSVMVDGYAVEHREHLASMDARTVEVPINDGDDDGSTMVEIIGTYVIPEFPLAIAILAVSTVALLTMRRLSLLIK